MRHLSRPALLAMLLVLVLLPCGLPAAGQTASLVKDILPGFRNHSELSPGHITVYKNIIFFQASEPSTGREIWSDDGTGTGPRLLADLCPGECSSTPRILGVARSLLFGLAVADHQDKATLWRTDGTRQETFLLPPPLFDIYIPFNRFNDEMTPPVLLARDNVYFTGCRSANECSLWRSDGTLKGTRDLAPGASDVAPVELVAVGNRVFFSTYKKLWITDGTVAGTVVVKEFAKETPRRLAALGSKLMFLAADPTEELWISDGTATGTRPITSLAPEHPFQQTSFLKALDGRIYFVVDDITHGAELWSSDGTPQGTVRITEFGFYNPFGADGDRDLGLRPGSLVKVGERVYFVATDGLSGFKIWSTGGTPASTSQVCSSCSFSTPQEAWLLVQDNGQIVFRAADEAHGSEIWATDGTAAGTRLLKDICPGSCGSTRSELIADSGRIYFSASDSRSEALWTTDGTPARTRQFAEVSPLALRDDSPLDLATLGRTAYFQAWNDNERQLWASDGTRSGTRRIDFPLISGKSADVSDLLAGEDRVYFTACESDSSRVIWSSEGTAETTRRTQEGSDICSLAFDEIDLLTAGGTVYFFKGRDHSERNLWRLQEDGRVTILTHFTSDELLTSVTSFQGQIYFSIRRGDTAEIWRSDGTPQGTVRAFDLPAGTRSAEYLKGVGPYLWFMTDMESSYRDAVWRSDGTTSGTHEVLGDLSRIGQDPEFVSLGDHVYFIALHPNGDDFDFQVWRSDGTPAGTTAVTSYPFDSNIRFFPAELTVFQGNLYFLAGVTESRRGLWRTDGTAAGTALLGDFPYSEDFFTDAPRFGLMAANSMLVFTIDDGVHGREPWRSDGTAAGTTLLRDVFPGPSSSEPSSFTEAAGSLFFSANDGTHGFEPWRTDGTSAGTRMVQDINPEGLSSYPSSFAFAGGRLFFGADDGVSGHELWSLPLSGPPCQPSDKVLCLNGGRFKLEAAWRTSESSGPGYARALTPDTGYFFFFDDDNVEVVAKVLDGQGINGHFWVYYGALSNVEYHLTVTDTQTGLARRYFNPESRFASVGDSQAFGPLGAYELKSIAPPSPAPEISERLDLSKATGTCVPAATRLCLSQGRFAVEIAWEDFSGERGVGKAVGLTNDTGYFWFFNDANVETIIKVLDATAVNGKFWVYYGALSDVKYDITVTDTLTGRQKVYKNPKGRFASAGDISAF